MTYGTAVKEDDWLVVNNVADTADNGGATIQNPDDSSDPGMAYNGTHFQYTFHQNVRRVQLRLKYANDAATITDPVVQVFGKDGTGDWIKLYSSGGIHEIRIATNVLTDHDDGTNNYTDPVTVVTGNAVRLAVGVKTAYNAVSNEGSVHDIECRSVY